MGPGQNCHLQIPLTRFHCAARGAGPAPSGFDLGTYGTKVVMDVVTLSTLLSSNCTWIQQDETRSA